MKKILFSLLMFVTCVVNAQNVGIGTNTPDASALLDLSASNKGFTLPRLTTQQRKAISNPAMGLMVFDRDKGSIMFYDGAAWRAMVFADENKSDPQSRTAGEPAANSNFGSHVAISGDYAIVGAPGYDGPSLNNMGLAYIFNKTSNGWLQVARLAARDSAASDYFGGSVSISGDYAVVGAANKNVNSMQARGKVYVYRRSGSQWLLDTALVKPQGAAYEDFGWAVGICAYNTGGPGLVIGIPYSDAAGPDRGEAYCYRKSGNTWSFIQNILPTDLGNADYYGTTVSCDTDYVAIAATGQDNLTYAYADAGAAYIYAYGGNVWNFQQKLQGSVVRGQFGFALSLHSNRLAVSAPWATTYSNTSSSVYLYTRTGASWVNTTSLFIYNFEVVPNAGQIQPVSGGSISIANLTFGISLSLSGNTLLVGSSGGYLYPNGGSSYYSDRLGSVYMYKNLSGNNFTRVNMLQADYPVIGDLHGASVGISAGNFIMGSPNAVVNGQLNAGNVYFGYQNN